MGTGQLDIVGSERLVDRLISVLRRTGQLP